MKEGNRRVKSWFALLPVTICKNNIKETRWLERVTVVQEAQELMSFSDFTYEPMRFLKWVNVEFTDQQSREDTKVQPGGDTIHHPIDFTIDS